MMTKKEYDSLANDLIDAFRGIIDRHPRCTKMTELAKRNMAYSAGWHAVSALTKDDIEAA